MPNKVMTGSNCTCLRDPILTQRDIVAFIAIAYVDFQQINVATYLATFMHTAL